MKTHPREKVLVLLPLFLIFLFTGTNAQSPLRVMFWNVENLFDCMDNPDKEDDEFLPESTRHWTFFRYRKKLINLAKGIIAAGEGDFPALIGLCEVENDTVMEDLLRITPLGKYGYRYFITNSPDRRGINVALLYKRDRFRPLARRDLTIPPSHSRMRPTRDILHITGLLSEKDTLDLFICHFPSRSGGESETRPARIAAHRILRNQVVRVEEERLRPLILIMGDLNDYPGDSPLVRELLAFPLNEKSEKPESSAVSGNSVILHDLIHTRHKNRTGSHKYQGEWGYLDHMIVNTGLLDPAPPYISEYRVFNADFLLTEDTRYFGKRPLRTYYGYRYEGGFSDHLPIIADLKWE